TESMLITLGASVLALALALVVTPALSYFTDKKLSIMLLVDTPFLIGFLVIMVAVGLVSGSYPAFVLSSQEAVTVLKSNSGKFSSNAILRKILVVFQFVVSVILISGTIMVYRQIDFMRNAKLGFDSEQLVVIPVQRSSLLPKYETFRDLLLLNSSITHVTGAHAIVGRDYQTNNYKKEGQDDFTTYP